MPTRMQRHAIRECHYGASLVSFYGRLSLRALQGQLERLLHRR